MDYSSSLFRLNYTWLGCCRAHSCLYGSQVLNEVTRLNQNKVWTLNCLWTTQLIVAYEPTDTRVASSYRMIGSPWAGRNIALLCVNLTFGHRWTELSGVTASGVWRLTVVSGTRMSYPVTVYTFACYQPTSLVTSKKKFGKSSLSCNRNDQWRPVCVQSLLGAWATKIW